MRRRMILSTTIASIAIALAVFCVGVYASMTQEFAMSNTIGFKSSEHIYLSFEGEISSCKQTEGDVWKQSGVYNTKDEYLYAKGLKYSQKFKEEDRQTQGQYNSYVWTVTESIRFIDDKTAIVYTFELYNYSTVKTEIMLSFKQNGTSISNKVSCAITNNSRVSVGPGQTIENYTGIQTIILDEYVIGQAEQPAKCVFTVSTSISGGNFGAVEEENNFVIEAAKHG